MSEADPRRSWGFRRRIVLARAAAGFESAWVALWPTLALVGVFLVVSLLGLWALLPGTAASGGTDAVWFSAGPDEETHGLLGVLRPAS